MRVSEFEYVLPEASIAQTAVVPRHSSRLLDTVNMGDHNFLELADLLRPGDLVVVNDTRVRAARLVGTREGTGGRVELLIVDRRPDGLWEALAKPARRLRPGVRVEFGGLTAVVESTPDEGLVVVDLLADDVEEAIELAGEVPLPPYFSGTLKDPDRYQTVFASDPGSAAAPTAGLHFTDEVIERLRQRDVALATVDLHVSMDTFRPISVGRIEEHKMHSERCVVPEATARAVMTARERGSRIIAVGTTVVRTLESFADDSGRLRSGTMETDLFIRPGFRFRVVDGLVTNFHMPGSTLLVMLAAFMGSRWRDVYETALIRGYRFLSFGDAMYAERAPF